MSHIWFTSDLHLSTKQSLKKVDSRPFNTVNQMNRALIDNFNSVVAPGDIVHILGDLTTKCDVEWANATIKQLNGRKILINGNHDKPYDETLFADDIKDYMELRFRGTLFVLSHYPMMDWKERDHGAIQLHGHIHSGGEYNQRNRIQGIRRYDVGVDANNYYPVSLDEILDYFQV